MAKKKKGFGSMLAGIFVEPIDSDEDEEFEEEVKNLPKTKQDYPMPKVKEPKKKEPEPELVINNDIVNSIKQVMEDNNLEGYDYYEFMQSVAEQSDMPSEKRRFEVVFSVAKGWGLSKEHLITTADHYIEVIENHRKNFEGKINSEEQDKVLKLKSQAELIDRSILEKEELIESLREEMDALKERKESMLTVVNENEAEITQLRQEGNLAYKLFINQIKDGKNKINEYIS